MVKDTPHFMKDYFTKEERAQRLKNIRKFLEMDDNQETKDKIKLNSEFGKLAKELKGENGKHYLLNADGQILEISDTQYYTEFTKEELERMDRLHKKYRDEQFLYWKMLERSIKGEGKNQVAKWGVQEHTLIEWLMYTTEELGELAKAISEFVYRGGTTTEIYKEAIQVVTLALKIAEMIEVQR